MDLIKEKLEQRDKKNENSIKNLELKIEKLKLIPNTTNILDLDDRKELAELKK